MSESNAGSPTPPPGGRDPRPDVDAASPAAGLQLDGADGSSSASADYLPIDGAAVEHTSARSRNYVAELSLWLGLGATLFWALAWLLGSGLRLLAVLFGTAGLVLAIIGTIRSDALRRGKALGVVAMVLCVLSLVASLLFAFSATAGRSSTTSEGEGEGVPAARAFPELGDRELALIAKDPHRSIGIGATVFGAVSQFNGATGRCAFLALTGASAEQVQWGPYRETAYFTAPEGNCELLDDLLEGDAFSAKVTVLGSVTYENTFGDAVTVLALRVESVELIQLPL